MPEPRAQPMPALFLGHGSPMNAIEDNAWTRAWQEIGRRLPRPRAVLCVSAHWQTAGVFVGGADEPDTIHDFGGFPPALYRLRYPAPGDPALAERVLGLLDPVLEPRLDHRRGLDHGAWQVLLHLFPRADVPVVQLSLDLRRPPRQHHGIGRMLGALRDEGVLLLGSGNIVHNLRLLDHQHPAPLPWAIRFRDAANACLDEGRIADLLGFDGLPDAELAVPPPAEHFLPLLYVLGAAREGEWMERFNDDVTGSLSMTSLALGLPPAGRLH